ncbi:hypothetical protein CMO83_00485 [Candidatus Woesearchaeota archaeon]|jgi:uncharacterized protein (UPF0333 family)|nr:hypothetical protein [Candidatus Woesearchaeota archaeon]|tara:strand:- start:13651 stop:14061 length:411 start_codon:yes stop_codon:yes gene_type:complete
MPLKSQVSVEYMLIMGFAALMTLPLLIIYYTYSSDTSDSVAASQALQIARKIADSSESVYYLGKPSQTTLKLNFPDKIDSTNVSNREVVFKIKTTQGITEVVEVSSVNMSGTLPTSQGIHIITLKAQDGFVQITSN